jgi:hypothetical protein
MEERDFGLKAPLQTQGIEKQGLQRGGGSRGKWMASGGQARRESEGDDSKMRLDTVFLEPSLVSQHLSLACLEWRMYRQLYNTMKGTLVKDVDLQFVTAT